MLSRRMLDPRLYAVAFFILLVILSCIEFPWNYDGHGAVVTHLELQNDAYISEYRKAVAGIFGDDGFLFILFDTVLLPLFVVPIRWTYAVGFSSFLHLANYISLDWNIAKPLLTLPSILGTGLGLILILNALRNRGVDNGVPLVFLTLLIWSPMLLWWSVSLSSYANHVLAAGLLFYAGTKDESDIGHRKIFGRISIARASAPLLNYQYIPIAALFGFIQFIQQPKKFFSTGLWRGWVLGCCVSAASALFLYFRAKQLGNHGDPTYAALTEIQIKFYSFPQQASEILSIPSYLVSRYTDIIFALYGQSPPLGNTNLATAPSLCVLVLCLAPIYWLYRRADKKLMIALFIMIGGTVLQHLFGVLPLSPKRHQLVILVPLCLVAALAIVAIVNKLRIERFLQLLVPLMFLGGFIYQTHYHVTKSAPFPIERIRYELSTAGVDRLILAPCDLQPMLYRDIRLEYKPIYNCGSRIIERIPNHIDKLAVWSSMRPISEVKVESILRMYSQNEWDIQMVAGNGTLPGHMSIYVADRVAK